MSSNTVLSEFLESGVFETVEELATAISEVSAAVERIELAGINRRALVVLLADLIPGRMPRRSIEMVLDALPRLSEYLSKEKR